MILLRLLVLFLVENPTEARSHWLSTRLWRKFDVLDMGHPISNVKIMFFSCKLPSDDSLKAFKLRLHDHDVKNAIQSLCGLPGHGLME